jgi:tRNA threonylcarbamoyl adenosine modification protein YeaZ
MERNIFAVSACLKRCSVAFLYEKNIFEANEYIDAAANLVWLADNLAKSHNIDFRKIDGIITLSGPGSFTGIRTAQSFAKGLSLSLQLPVACVSCFDVIRAICNVPKNVPSVIVIKSEKDQVYYQNGLDSGVSAAELLKEKIPKEAVLIGDAADAFPNIIRIENFREAKHLLGFSHLITSESKISPMYIAKKMPTGCFSR